MHDRDEERHGSVEELESVDARFDHIASCLKGEWLNYSFVQRPVHPSFGWVKTNIWTGRNMGGRVKNEGAKRSSKTIDIVSYALKVSVNGVKCVCSPFQVKKIHLKFVNWLNS